MSRLREPIAIVGMACLFPKARNVASYWRNILEGVDAVTEIPESHWSPDDYFDPSRKPDHTYARRGAFIDPVDFSPIDFGITPKALEATDTTQLLGMLIAQRALADAGYPDGEGLDRDRVSVVLGVTGTLPLVIPLGARLGHPVWRKALKDAGVPEEVAEDVVTRISDEYVPWQEASFPGLLGNVVAGRIANRLDLHGTNCVVDAACASSLSAIHLATLELAAGRSDLALTGGLDTFNDIFMYMCFSQTPALSPSGDARPFDRSGDGTILGEGLGMLALKRLEDAERDGDRIHAVIRSMGTSSDGRGNAIYAPSAEGQKRALRDAYEGAGIDPSTVELVEAHGTGTRVGDSTESEALAEVFREARADGTWCALGSVKSQIGHTKAAAGAAGLIKVTNALHRKVLPPTLKVTQPVDALADTPLYVNTTRRPWIRSGHPRRAGVSSFGFGGSNFHCVLEEYRPRMEAADFDGAVTIIALSGESDQALARQLDALPDDPEQLRHEAVRTRADFSAEAEARLILVVRPDDLDAVRDPARRMLGGDHDSTWVLPQGAVYASGNAAGRVAWLFPGQGAQYAGMLSEMACRFPEMQSAVEKADAAFVARTGDRLVDFIWPHPAFDDDTRAAQSRALRATNVAQPALGAVSAGAANVLRAFGSEPDATAGHSYGELVALWTAGLLSTTALHELSRLRGELMASGDGTMLAVASSADHVMSELGDLASELVAANHNAPDQLVLSGPVPTIEAAAARLAGAGLRCKRLDVAAAFHSPAVSGAEEPLRNHLEDAELGDPTAPVYANRTGGLYPSAPDAAAELLASQVAHPVRWVELIERMYEDGIRTFVEVGPGARLAGLVQRILEGKPHVVTSVDKSAGRTADLRDLAMTLATLAAHRHHVDLSRWDPDAPRPEQPASSRHTVAISGSNYVTERKPRPPRAAKLVIQTEEETTPMRGNGHDANGNGNSNGRAHSNGAAPATSTDRHIEALLRLQEQTADVHRKFLETQEAAQKAIVGALTGRVETDPPVKKDEPLSQDRAQRPAAASTFIGGSDDESDFDSDLDDDRSSDRHRDHSGVVETLLAVVAEKTGYPTDVLELDMDLDADLGIDSIKRVEILGALTEKMPELPEVKPEDLGRLHTLGEIASALTDADATARPLPEQAAPARASQNDSITQVLLEVVADKTGYPLDVLELDMDLDADLGIDSIKRVEILGALTEKMPELPDVKPEDLGRLHTLGEIVGALSGSGTTTTAPPAVSDPSPRVADDLRASSTDLVVQRPIATPVRLGEPLAMFAGEILVTHDGSPLTAALEQELTRRGLTVRVVSINEARTLEIPSRLGGLILLAPATGCTDTFLRDALALSRRCAPALELGLLVTVSRLDGRFGVQGLDAEAEALSGALAGLAKTASAEWAGATCKAVDLATDVENPARALTEAILRETPVEIGLTAAGPTTLTLETLTPEASAMELSSHDVVVVSGGARGVTADIARHLARAAQPELVLLGRSPLPDAEDDAIAALRTEPEVKRALIDQGRAPREAQQECARILAAREIRATLTDLEAAGSRVHYRSADVRNAASVAEALRGFAPTVLIHGAGVLADRLIADKTDEDFDAVFGTKVSGLRNLLAAGGSNVRTVVLFSSSTARFGRRGQADYAMANEALNKMAQQLRGTNPDLDVLSVNWGPLDGGMVTDGLKQLFAAEGIGLIDPTAGARLLSQLLAAGIRGECVVLAGTGLSKSTVHDGEVPNTVFVRNLDLDSHPVLASHVVAGRPVVPMALLVEWMAHGAMHENPGLSFAGLTDLRIFQGVTLESREPYGIRVTAGAARQTDRGFVIPVTVWSARGNGDATRHAAASVRLVERLPEAPQPHAHGPLMAYPTAQERIYADILFHGHALQVIDRIEGVRENELVARVHSAPPPTEWMHEPLRNRWLADPAVLDGSFQSVILWTQAAERRVALPMHLGELEVFAPFPSDGAVEVRVRVESRNNLAVADIDYVDGDGRLLARATRCECVLDESLTRAFRQNQPFVSTRASAG